MEDSAVLKHKKWRKRIWYSLALILAFVVFANIIGRGWMVYHEGSFRGKVIDAETGEPIEGAVVVAVYNVSEYGIAESGTSATSVKEALTGENGEFYVQPRVFVHCYPFATRAATEFIIYKPGYTSFPGRARDYFHKYFPNSPLKADIYTLADYFRKGVTIELKQLKTKEERMGNIPGRPAGMGAWHLPKLFKAINEERKRFSLKEVG